MQKIENGIKSIDGVDIPSINVLFNSSKVIFNFDENKASIEDAENVVAKLGYEVKKSQVKDI
jgi:copper chaperone CopZ